LLSGTFAFHWTRNLPSEPRMQDAVVAWEGNMRGRYLPWVLAASIAALGFQALQNMVVSMPAEASPVYAAGLANPVH
jgi:hypothetical protein